MAARVAAPACLDGDIREISADDDELVALDSRALDLHDGPGAGHAGALQLDLALGDPVLDSASGSTVPRDVRTWAWSVISPREEVYWDDPAGNQHTIGEGKVSHIWSLDPSGQRFSYIDPWLPLDRSYEMCGPCRGRLQAVEPLDERLGGVRDERASATCTRAPTTSTSRGPTTSSSATRTRTSAGCPTRRSSSRPPRGCSSRRSRGGSPTVISIEKVGRGTLHRTLRVEGLDGDGRTGFWEKDVGELDPAAWRFVSTGAPLIGTEIRNPAGDASARTLGAGEDARYVGDDGRDPRLQHLLQPGGAAGPAGRRPAGGPDPPRGRSDPDRRRGRGGSIRRRARRRGRSRCRRRRGRFSTGGGSSLWTFLRRGMRLSLEPLGWTFRRAAPPPGGVCVSEAGFASASVKPAGSGLAIALRARTESPVFVEVLRGRRVVARFVRVEGFEWPGRVRRGVYVVRLRTLTPGGRLATRLFPVLRRRGRFRSLPPFVSEERCELLRSFCAEGAGVPARVCGAAFPPSRPRGRWWCCGAAGGGSGGLRLGTVRPERPTPFRISTKGLRRGRYRLSLTVRASDGRVERARLGALRPR